MRILFYAQHLSGVGHFVRSLAIARALAARHEVWLTDGGMPVPCAAVEPVRMLPLTPLRRSGGRLVPLHGGSLLAAVLQERRAQLFRALESMRPDVVVVEHYPFSKWDLAGEITFMLQAARRHNPAARTVCSLRDIALQTSHEQCPAAEYQSRVLALLHEWFDALMVHADPQLCRLQDSFPAAGQISIPVFHTGIVCAAAPVARRLDHRYLVASAGGGRDAVDLLVTLAETWPLLRERCGLQGRRLALFQGLQGGGQRLAGMARADDSIELHAFSAEYASWLATAELSISCAGYNTCADLLRSGTRAVLVPNTAMSDQVVRARLLQASGLAQCIDPAALGLDSLTGAIGRSMRRETTGRAPGLKGAESSRDFIERLCRPAGRTSNAPAASP